MFHCSGDNQSRVNNTSLGVGGFVGSPVGEAAAGAARAKGTASGGSSWGCTRRWFDYKGR